MEHFNQLTPAELERLACLAEELNEAGQAIGKIIRHGYESNDNGNRPFTNRQYLEKELGDVRWAMIFMCHRGDVSKQEIHNAADQKAERVKQYLHHQLPTKGLEK